MDFKLEGLINYEILQETSHVKCRLTKYLEPTCVEESSQRTSN